mmetsp:Transcript_4344/g.7263  ORF Transcript_4344/g.7263 Transcript_4344/m.7263 type:complete len:767 (-) Transcript_4344:33-2333(-)|eukprot:CAMPEP_0119022834 /NCGR_PEP_ID=MMETSP1176-20130426/28810_1 /TAXON_ID=265551 /ORGANISM="Synedropsis recta cf, Strain CCMP1620" /LENGTH=766 /DNA_ID=CAMNT_0006977777 /DNA_START=65 /DNA_END=2365 /DNA_ORIENTATION=-
MAPQGCLRRPSAILEPKLNMQGAVDTAMDLAPAPSFSDISVRDLTTRLYSNRKSVGFYIWYTLIAVVALLDFLAKVVADFIRDDDEDVDAVVKRNPFGFRLRRRKELLLELDNDPFIVNFIQFLDKYSIPISVLFSLLWLIDAFVKATYKRIQLLNDLDRKHLLDGTKTDNELKEVSGAWGAFYRTVLVQCLLMPISFFIIAHHAFSVNYSAQAILLDEDEKLRFNFTDVDGKVDEVHSFGTHLSQSIIFVIAQYTGTVFVRHTGMHVRSTIKSKVRRFGRKMAFFAIRNPRQFAQRMRKALRSVRWLKYLTPLIATGNKLRGNTIDLLTKYGQRRNTAKLEKVRLLLFKSRLSRLPPEEVRKEAAIMVQRAYRRRQAAKALRAVQLIQGNAEQWAAQRMQHIFRGKLKRIRARILDKRNELNELKIKQQQMQKQKETMSVEERRRMYELQDELGAEASHLLNQRMLMRPNTRFAVTWKIIFVFCVLFEISQLAFAPTLAKYIDEQSGEKLNIGKVLELNLIPTPASEWKECGNLKKPVTKVGRKGSSVVHWIKRVGRKAEEEAMKEVQEDEKLDEVEEDDVDAPWYCHKPFRTAQGLYITFLKIAIYEFLVFVGLVCFLDVFVTFFTGELNPENGNLIPKPFVSRWLIPGIILQLLVNPQMETVSKYVGAFLDYTHQVGPIRVYRWTAAFFYPLLSVIGYYLIHDVWRPLVKKNNNNTLDHDPFAMPIHADRRAQMQQTKPLGRPKLADLASRRSISVLKLSISD